MTNVSSGIASASPWDSIYQTFSASIRSVGTACTLAAVGVYLHQRNIVSAEGKRTLALISQQVTFPLFLFTKIIHCNQDWSDDPCPDITKSLEDVWMLLFWPLYVVGMGILVGHWVAKVCETPKDQIKSVLASIGFANSTGLPITLLTVVHQNFPSTSDLGRIDPTLFLSVYLLLYPVLQWGIGGWMLAPDEQEHGGGEGNGKQEDRMGRDEQAHETSTERSHLLGHASIGESMRSIMSPRRSIRSNVLNNKDMDDYYLRHRRGLSSTDEGLYVSELDLTALLEQADEDLDHHPATVDENAELALPPSPLHLSSSRNGTLNMDTAVPQPPPPPPPGPLELRRATSVTLPEQYEGASMWETFHNIMERCLQPPVVGAVVGIIVAVLSPVRGLLVDLDRQAAAPFEWVFDGLYAVGQTAVPINMMILGCNLSASHNKSRLLDENKGLALDDSGLLPQKTMIGIVIGKMVILPVIGILSAMFLRNYILNIPDDIDGAFYLVLMIVFLTPTANNVMVMVELSGSNAKEGIARVIALQYATAPLILSCTMTVAIGFASHWS